jgi:hypothetical protein
MQVAKAIEGGCQIGEGAMITPEKVLEEVSSPVVGIIFGTMLEDELRTAEAAI